MARNGSGTYSLLNNTAYPATNGVTLLSADWNAELADIATALTGSVAADGQTPMTGNLPMGGNRVTGVAAAAALTDATNENDVQSGRLLYLTGTAGTNTVTAALSGFTTYATGNAFRFVAAGTNTGAVTLNINSIAAKAITKNGTVALQGGEIQSGQVVNVVYDGTQFQLVDNDRLTAATVQASTSGTSIDFASIPTWAKRVTLSLAGVSTNGTSALLVQIGAGAVSAVSYVGNATAVQNAAATSISAITTGFGIVSGAAANLISGSLVLTLVDAATGTWVASGNFAQSAGSFFSMTAGHKVLSGTLDRVRLTTITGADTFDAGSVNILYE